MMLKRACDFIQKKINNVLITQNHTGLKIYGNAAVVCTDIASLNVCNEARQSNLSLIAKTIQSLYSLSCKASFNKMSRNVATKYDQSDDMSEIWQALWRQKQHGDISTQSSSFEISKDATIRLIAQSIEDLGDVSKTLMSS